MRLIDISELGGFAAFLLILFVLWSICTMPVIWFHNSEKDTYRGFFKHKWTTLRTTKDYNAIGATILMLPIVLVFGLGFVLCFGIDMLVYLDRLVCRCFNRLFKNKGANKSNVTRIHGFRNRQITQGRTRL